MRLILVIFLLNVKVVLCDDEEESGVSENCYLVEEFMVIVKATNLIKKEKT